MSLKVDAAYLPAQVWVSCFQRDYLDSSNERVICTRHTILEREGCPPRRAGMAYPSQKIYL